MGLGLGSGLPDPALALGPACLVAWSVFIFLTLCFLTWEMGPSVCVWEFQNQEDLDWSPSSAWDE